MNVQQSHNANGCIIYKHWKTELGKQKFKSVWTFRLNKDSVLSFASNGITISNLFGYFISTHLYLQCPWNMTKKKNRNKFQKLRKIQ